MTSLASSESDQFSASTGSTRSTRKSPRNGTLTPIKTQNKPRTRSAIIRASQMAQKTPGTPRKRTKRSKRASLRSSSPMIDLTGDEAMASNHSDEESPLKRVKSKSKAKKSKGRGSSRLENGDEHGNEKHDEDSKVSLSDTVTTVASSSSEAETNSHDVFSTSTQEPEPLPNDGLIIQAPNPVLDLNMTRLSPQKRRESSVDLNSSPIKKADHFERPARNQALQKLSLNVQLSSSPTKKAKSVAFSDDLAFEDPSSPISPRYSENGSKTTPRRSILKPSACPEVSSPLDPNNSRIWVKTSHSLSHQFAAENHSPSNPLFWQPGTIIQLEPKSSDLPQLVDGCIDVLKDENFDKKFEVYATLNLVCRSNESSVLADLVCGEHSAWLASVEKNTGYTPRATSSYIKTLCHYAKRDIERIEENLYVKCESGSQGETERQSENGTPSLSPGRSNPFQSRALTQAVKLMSFFLNVPSINSLVPASDIKWFYNRACDVIVRPTLSKSLVSPYLSIIKDCPFPAKKKKLMFENNPNPLSEKMLFAILNMNNYLSTSLINEKFIALRNIINNFPAISAKHFQHWFPGLLLNLCDLKFGLYSKVVGTGITVLLEAARNFLDNNDIGVYTRKFLESPLSLGQSFWASDDLQSSGESDVLALDYVVDSLTTLVREGFYKFAMDIWVGVTLILGKTETGIQNWKHFDVWLSVQRLCFREHSVLAKETALYSWKVIIYTVCNHELKDPRLYTSLPVDSSGKGLVGQGNKLKGKADEILRQKTKLLMHPFSSISPFDTKRELVDGFHKCFLSILYNLLGHQPKLNSRYFQTIWDRIIQSAMLSFYFKKEISTPYMHHLGITLISKLFKPSSPSSEKSFSGIRCLHNDPIAYNEIGSLNPRWMYLRFDKVLPIVFLVFKSKHLSFDAKTDTFICFLDAIKHVTKKEVQVSNTTFDLLDNLPLCLEAMLTHSKISYEHLNRVILSLNDTFGAGNLLSMTDNTKSVIEPILTHGLPVLAEDQAHSILGLWYSTIGEKKNVKFLAILNKINVSLQRNDVASFICENLNGKKIGKLTIPEMVMIGEMFRDIKEDFGAIAKKLIQQLVLLKPEEFDVMVLEVGIATWNVSVFNFFAALMHNAPSDHLKETTMNLIEKRSKNEQEFAHVAEFLLTNKFDYEISRFKSEVVRAVQSDTCRESSLREAWENYVKNFECDYNVLDSILVTALEHRMEIKTLVGDRWAMLPNTKAAWDKTKECPLNGGDEKVDQTDDNELLVENSGSQSSKICEPQMSQSISQTSSEDSVMSEGDEQANLHESQENQAASGQGESDQISNDASRHEVIKAREPGNSINEKRSEALLSSNQRETKSGKSFQELESQTGQDLRETGVKETSLENSTVVKTKAQEKKRKFSDEATEQTNFADKKRRVNESMPQGDLQYFVKSKGDLKQVSDSEDSAKDHAEMPKRGQEIVSSSEEKRLSSQDQSQSQSLVQVQSTANNTSDESSELTAAPHQRGRAVATTALETVVANSTSESLKPYYGNLVTSCTGIFNTTTDTDLESLGQQERYDLETYMMEFLLRIRRSGLGQKT